MNGYSCCLNSNTKNIGKLNGKENVISYRNYNVKNIVPKIHFKGFYAKAPTFAVKRCWTKRCTYASFCFLPAFLFLHSTLSFVFACTYISRHLKLWWRRDILTPQAWRQFNKIISATQAPLKEKRMKGLFESILLWSA